MNGNCFYKFYSALTFATSTSPSFWEIAWTKSKTTCFLKNHKWKLIKTFLQGP